MSLQSPAQKKTRFRYFLYDHVNRHFFEIQSETVCGRLEGDLRFPSDDVVSRRQCRFTVVGNDIYIEDLNSTNKTKVNTVPLRSGYKRRIQLHDVIEFGTQRFVLTNQDKITPANSDDGKQSHLYKGVRNDDGSLSSQDTRTKRTRVILDRASFQKLRIKEFFLPRSMRPRRKEVEPPKPAPRPHRGKLAPAVFFVAVFAAASSVIYLWNLRADHGTGAASGRSIASITTSASAPTAVTPAGGR